MIELHKGQKILKERINWRDWSLNKRNSKMFFKVLAEAGYVKVNRGGRTVIVKRNLNFK